VVLKVTNKTQLLLATANPHKVAEIQQLLRDIPYQVIAATDLAATAELDPEETAPTIAGNAILKAHVYGQASGLLSVADDSGLEIAALNGEPGVKSKRYIPGTDADRNQFVLTKLQGMENRQARFVTVLCLYDPVTKQQQLFEGEVMGQIGLQSKGTSGFGYDPIFIPDDHDQTFAELGSEIKNQLSHRARAVQKLRAYLAQLPA
jgi:XTP/dITP diphosphohydrolase